MTTGVTADTIVADSKYGTIDNFIACHDRGIEAHVPDLRGASVKRLKIFQEDRFQYDPERDVYHCPAGNELKPKSLHKNRQSRDYAAPKKTCASCQLKEQYNTPHKLDRGIRWMLACQ
jgi:transposase